MIHTTTYRKKNYTHLPQKKLHDWTIFLYTTYIFSPTVPSLKIVCYPRLPQPIVEDQNMEGRGKG